MSVYLTDDMLAGVVNSLLSRLKKGGIKSDVVRTYMQAVGQIRWVGRRDGDGPVNQTAQTAIF